MARGRQLHESSYMASEPSGHDRWKTIAGIVAVATAVVALVQQCTKSTDASSPSSKTPTSQAVGQAPPTEALAKRGDDYYSGSDDTPLNYVEALDWYVSVSARHLEPQSVVANDRVHQELRWTRWERRESSCAGGTVRS